MDPSVFRFARTTSQADMSACPSGGRRGSLRYGKLTGHFLPAPVLAESCLRTVEAVHCRCTRPLIETMILETHKKHRSVVK